MSARVEPDLVILDSNVATVSLTVNPVNDAPVAANGSASGDEDAPIAGQLVATDVDNTAAQLSYSLVGQAQHGTVTVHADGNYTYTPGQDFNGTDSFTFRANDGSLDSNVATVSLTVNAVNDAPVAANGSASGDEDTPIAGQLVATDVDNTAAQLSYSLVGQAQHGTVTVTVHADGNYTYTPGQDFNGTDSFTFRANDGSLDSNVATVSLTVNPVNDAPAFTSPSTFSVAENQVAVGTLTAVDPEHDSFSFTLTGGADQGFFSIDARTGALRFVNSPDFETPEDANHDNVYAVIVSATDVFGATSTQAISVTVTNVAEVGSTINGGNGNDMLTGTPGNDTISGGNGNDTINGGDGNDNISGGNGDDILSGGRGNDVIDGGNGNDTIDGGSGNNQLSGGNGNDVMRAGDGNNSFDGGNGNDIMTAGNGNNTFTGGNGNETVTAGNGNNTFIGGNGNDTVTFGNGNNSLSGGNGNDVFHVGTGNNALTGGSGNDVFAFGPGFGKNIVTDFNHGDHIEFDGGVFANFQAVQAASHQVGADTVISLDADHAITLQNVALTSLHASDFFLA